MLDEPVDLKRTIPGPREGWLSVALLAVMLLSLCWSVQAAGWLDQLDFLAPVAIWALLAGLILGMSRLSIAITIPISAVVGAGILLWSVGGEYFPELDQLARLDLMRGDRHRRRDHRLPVRRRVQQALVLAIGLGSPDLGHRLHRRLRPVSPPPGPRHHPARRCVPRGQPRGHHPGPVLLPRPVQPGRAPALAAGRPHRAPIGLGAARASTRTWTCPASIMRSGVLFTAPAIGIAWILTSVAVAAPLTQAVRQPGRRVDERARPRSSGFFQGFNSSNARPVVARVRPADDDRQRSGARATSRS